MGLRLAEGEEVRFRSRVKGSEVVITDRRLIVRRGSNVADVRLQHVIGTELSRRLGTFIAGVVLLIIGVIACLTPVWFLGLILLVAGAALAIYGWLNRYELRVTYPGGSIVFRDGSAIPELHRRIHEQVMQVKVTQ